MSVIHVTEDHLLRMSKSIAAKEYLSELPKGCSDWVEAFDAVSNFSHPDPYIEVNDVSAFLFWGVFDGHLFSEVVEYMENLQESVYSSFSSSN